MKKSLLRRFSGRDGGDGLKSWSWSELESVYDGIHGLAMGALFAFLTCCLWWVGSRATDAFVGLMALISLFSFLNAYDEVSNGLRARRARLFEERAEMVRAILED